MAAPVFVNSGTAASGTTANLTPGNPASLVAGNLLVAICYHTVGASGTVWTAPAGWTQLDDKASVQNGIASTIFWKITTGTEGSNTFTNNQTGFTWWAQIHQFSGVDQTTPIRGTQKSFQSAITYVWNSFGAIPTSATDSLAVWFVVKSGVPTGGGTGWTQAVNNTTQGYSLWTKAVATAGYTDDLTLTYGAAYRAYGNLGFELRSAATDTIRNIPYIKQRGLPVQFSSATSFTVSLPGRLTIGNILAIYSSDQTNTAVLTTAGYNQFQIPNFTGHYAYLLWRLIDGTEGSTYSFTSSVVGSPYLIALEIARVNRTAPFGGLNTNATGNSTTGTWNSWNTSKNNILAIGTDWFNGSETSTLTTPGTWNRLVSWGTASLAYQEMPTAGSATGTMSETFAASNSWGTRGFEVYPQVTAASFGALY